MTGNGLGAHRDISKERGEEGEMAGSGKARALEHVLWVELGCHGSGRTRIQCGLRALELPRRPPPPQHNKMTLVTVGITRLLTH